MASGFQIAAVEISANTNRVLVRESPTYERIRSFSLESAPFGMPYPRRLNFMFVHGLPVLIHRNARITAQVSKSIGADTVSHSE